MSDHEDETINEENAPPKGVPQITTITNIYAKFPYPNKGEYVIWAMKMQNFILSSDLLCWNIVFQGNNTKSMTTYNDGNLKIRPPVAAEEHQHVQREEKARIILLSALPDEHMGGFYHMIDARDIWNAIKARFKEGLDKGYDKMQKILTQMNTLMIKPDPEDVNMKFLRGLPPSWSGIALILKTKVGLEYISFDDFYNKLKFLKIDTKGYLSSSSTFSNVAFVSTARSSQGNLSYQETRNGGHTTTISVSHGSSSSKGSSKSKCSVVDDVIYSFFANHEIDQQLVYEDLDQMNKAEFEEYDLKHQMAMLSIKVFQIVLRAYATKIYMKLPKGGTGIVAATTGMDEQIKTSNKNERMICYIVNTAEYCHDMAEDLAENVSKIIDTQLANAVDMSADEFSAVINKAWVTLINGLKTKFDIEMAAMTRVAWVNGLKTKFDIEMAAMTCVPWGTLESMGDQSEYVNKIKMILNGSIPVVGSLLSPLASSLGLCFYLNIFKFKQISETGAQQTSGAASYLKFVSHEMSKAKVLVKLASSLGPRFYLNIFKCKQISECGAQQAVKTILLDIPSFEKQTSGAASYSKFVSREMTKAEALLKVILSPVNSVVDTYSALLPEGTPLEVQRILELKVIPAATPAPSPVVTQPSSALIASREDVLTRVAALGRGAATTGFKRFLALTEAAKDRTDGPFRKLFNA
uniref:Vps53 C-terminal domain-containing protein n=1 Tax=Tanacetum cinerariifolium TaxID=118510 RepID=A0A699GPZ5_TANCI|nr:hypothetical protein [Tanacetum cinerariifolium]